MPPVLASERDGVPRPVSISATQIPSFKVRSDETLFGPLKYLGGLELSASDSDFGGLSAFRLLDGGDQFVAVTDTGFWLTGGIERDEQGRLSGLSDVSLTAMRDPSGKVVQSRYYVDAEGLVIDDDDVLVSYERDHRIEVFELDGLPGASARKTLAHPIPDYEFRNNRGMETIAIAPLQSPLNGAVVVVSEKSLNKKGDIFAGIVTGPQQGVFFVRRHPPYDITDGDFLPNGDLLLLERRFSVAQGVGMRIRRIAADAIRPGKTVDGKVLIDVDFSYQIDNMEGLDVFEASDGSTRILLVSDDNKSLLQRTLLLEFELVE